MVEFAEKYSGETLSKKVKSNGSLVVVVSNGANDSFETCKMLCEQLSTFIGERLYVISVLM